MNYIDLINDESHLEILYETTEAYAKVEKTDLLDSLRPQQLEKLQESINQANEGKLTPWKKGCQPFKGWQPNAKWILPKILFEVICCFTAICTFAHLHIFTFAH